MIRLADLVACRAIRTLRFFHSHTRVKLVNGMARFVTLTGRDGIAGLAVSGDLDISGVEELLSTAGSLLDAGADVVELDLSGVTFIDSSGLGALVRLKKTVVAAGGQLRLVDVPRPVARILELTGLTDLFDDRPES